MKIRFSLLLIILFLYNENLYSLSDSLSVNILNYPGKNSNLEFLRKKIGDSRIVLIGERDHTDYYADIQKLDVISYLVNEMGFEILLLEHGMINIERAKTDTSLNEFSTFFHRSSQVDFLKGILSLKTIKLHGVDLDTWFRIDLQYLDSILPKVISDSPSWDKYNIVVEKVRKQKGNVISDIADVYILQNEVIRLIRLYSESGKQKDSQLIIQMLRNVTNSLYCFLTFKSYKKFKNHNFRDQQIFQNILFYLNHYYPQKKVIITMSNYHIMPNLGLDLPKRLEGSFPVANFLKQAFSEQLYVIGSIYYGGENGLAPGWRQQVKKKNENSIEYLAHSRKIDFGFIDLQLSHLTKEYELDPNLIIKSQNWKNYFDGLLYVDKMIPDTTLGYFEIIDRLKGK